MTTLFVAWQDKSRLTLDEEPTRAWFPVGRLDADVEKPLFRFRYTRGALRASEEAGFQPLDSFPTLDRDYRASELFPLFQTRIPSLRRPDYREFLKRHGLSDSEADPVTILSISGGGRQTDNLEVFPRMRKGEDGSFRCRFFVHGGRHINSHSRRRAGELMAGERLRVALEWNNPATGPAIQIQSDDDYHVIGWAPRYLVVDLLEALAQSRGSLEAHVVRVNLPPAPESQRVLVELAGVLPEQVEPMTTDDYVPVTAD